MSGVTAKRSKAAEVERRVREGLCLICDDEAKRRGLCFNHYQTFLRRQSKKGGAESQAEFETACIREGLLLRSGDMRTIKMDDPFAKV